MFYIGYKDKFSINNILLIFASYIVGNLYLSERVNFLSSLLVAEMNSSVVFLIIFILYLVFFVVTRTQIKKNSIVINALIIMGAMTYPLYLIHGNIGFIIFNIFYESINKYILLLLLISLMLLISYFIYEVLEKRMAKVLKLFFQNHILNKTGDREK